MAWAVVPQGDDVHGVDTVRVSISDQGPGGRTSRLYVSLSDNLRSLLGWQPGEGIGLRVGICEHLGQVQLYPVVGGAPLVKNPKGTSYQVRLRPGDVLGGITAEPCDAACEVAGVQPRELHITLPWADLKEALAEAGRLAA